jgi:hypothetical protein
MELHPNLPEKPGDMPKNQTHGLARASIRLLLIGGWACLGAVLGLLHLSLDLELILIPPLFVAALALGFIATTQTSRIGGVLLLLSTVVAPALFLVHRDSRSELKEHQVLRTPSADRGATRRQESPTVADFSEQPNDAGPEAGKESTWDGTAPADRPTGTKTRLTLKSPPKVDTIASPPDVRSRNPRAPLQPSPAAAQIPPGLPELEVTHCAPMQPPTTRDARARDEDAPPDQEADRDARYLPDDLMASLPFAGREIGDVFDEPLVREDQTNSGFQVGGTSMYTDDTNMYGRAWVRNGGTTTVETVPLLILWFDTNANIIATTRATVGAIGGIKAGGILDFEVRTPGDPRIVGYHYIVVP